MGFGNKCERVCVAIPVGESAPVYLIQLLQSVFGSFVFASSENVSHFETRK